MKISKITVLNYRSIRRAVMDASAFNVLVGQNNHGKTNLFDAIQWFYTGSGNIGVLKYTAAGADEEISLELEFSGGAGGAETGPQRGQSDQTPKRAW